jgi:hypothetical protein
MLALYIGLFSYLLQDRQRIDKQPPMRRQQALQQEQAGVTVVSRGEGGVRARVVLMVSGGELERIAAGVTRRQCGAAGWARHAAGLIVSLERQPRRVAAGAGCRTGGNVEDPMHREEKE